MGFRRHPVRVVVPATSANLGPAFDCAGLALDIEDELVAMVSDDEGVHVEVAGAGAADVPRDESHLVVRAMATAFRAMGQSPAGLVLQCRNDIPHGRGLGSSAAAIIGGMVLARALVEGGPDRFPDGELLQWAITMESHPDNISAALHGGLTLAWLADGRAECIRLQPHPAIVPIVAIPAQSVSTSHARTALPAQVPFPDAAFNLARASLLVHAMTNEPALLLEATADRLHQQARREMYRSSLALVEALRAESIAAMISGAGPSVIVLGTAATDLKRVQAVAGAAWLVRGCGVCDTGAREVPVEGA